VADVSDEQPLHSIEDEAAFLVCERMTAIRHFNVFDILGTCDDRSLSNEDDSIGFRVRYQHGCMDTSGQLSRP